jgi:hypothetical protein
MVTAEAYKARWDEAELTMELYEDKWDKLARMDLETAKAELRERFPGWQIWYVPNITGGPTWHARPLGQLDAATPEGLAGQIEREAVALSDSLRVNEDARLG